MSAHLPQERKALVQRLLDDAAKTKDNPAYLGPFMADVEKGFKMWVNAQKANAGKGPNYAAMSSGAILGCALAALAGGGMGQGPTTDVTNAVDIIEEQT